jgi:predicted HTH domain antitoxin
MRAVNIRELKNNPSAALREAREDMVVVMNRDAPQAVLVDLHHLGIPDVAGVRMALAVALFKQESVSLGYAARIAGKPLPEMISMLCRMGVPLVTVASEDVEHDFTVADAWFQSASSLSTLDH